MGHQKSTDLIHCDPKPLFSGIAETSGRDQRKGDGRCTILCRQSQALFVAGPQFLFLTMLPIDKEGAYCMDNILCLQLKGRCDESVPLGNETDGFPVCQELIKTGCLVDGSVAARPHRRMVIRRIDNDIRLHPGDIISDDLKRHKLTLF